MTDRVREAIRAIVALVDDVSVQGCWSGMTIEQDLAITALRARLAEPEPEPVAWQGLEQWETDELARDMVKAGKSVNWLAESIAKRLRAMNERPITRRPLTPEPVAWMVFTQDGQSVFVTDNPTDIGDDQRALPLYTAPPARQPLTPVEIAAMWRKFSSDEGFTTAQFVRNFARAIERAHGIGGNDE